MPENHHMTIFAVDDEPVIASTLAMILDASGYRATGFTSGGDAIKAAAHGCPDLLISDVSMPEINGIELAMWFKSFCSSCKVLLLSGALSTEARLEEAKQKGYDFHILAKPAHPEDVLAAIKKF